MTTPTERLLGQGAWTELADKPACSQLAYAMGAWALRTEWSRRDSVGESHAEVLSDSSSRIYPVSNTQISRRAT